MSVSEAYKNAKEIYAELGVNTDSAISRIEKIPVSMHCWQGDDVRGFENPDGDLTGGIQTTGNYPGRAATIEQLRSDFEKAASLIPGKKNISLHAIYLDNCGQKVERNEIEPKHLHHGLTGQKKAASVSILTRHTFLISSAPTASPCQIRISTSETSGIEHGIACRRISEYIGRELGTTVIENHWVPDGFKDIPVDRFAYRERLKESYDKIFSVKLDKKYLIDSVEGKVFGLGAESCTIGSHEFYLAYAQKNGISLTLDTGHYHPTEVVSDKISSALLFLDDVMLHVSRPVRWDSDHVVIFDDELKYIAQEILWGGFENRVHIGLDFFDASINRIAAWVIGTRNMQKALLFAAVAPIDKLRSFENSGDYTSRLAMLEEIKTLPFSAVWDYYCEKAGVPVRDKWINDVKSYEKDVLSGR